MSAATNPQLRLGRVYWTRELARWGANPPRLAKRLVREGKLIPLAHGLYAHPRRGRFGVVPPTDEEMMRAFLDGAPFVFTGPEHWNALGLGTTAVFSAPLVYNGKRSGTFSLGGRRFVLRRVAFPALPTPEWYAVDLLENAGAAGASREDLAAGLERAVRRGALDRQGLRDAARRFGTRRTQNVVDRAVERGSTERA